MESLGHRKFKESQNQYYMELHSIIVPQDEVLPNEKVIYNTNSVPGKNLPITL